MPKMTNKQVSISNRTNVKDFKGSDFGALLLEAGGGDNFNDYSK
jgi:hypothetical protein